MTVNYQVRLKDHNGSVVAIFVDWKVLTFNHEVNTVSTANFSIDGEDDRISLFLPDYQLEVWRADKDIGLDWYIEWEGFCRTKSLKYDSDGQATFTVYASSYLSLLKRRYILYYAGTPFTSKSGIGETVIKSFVSQNCTSIASTAMGRISNGIIPGFSVEPDYNRGYAWEGERTFKNLLTVVDDIALKTNLYYDVIGYGDALFQFLTYYEQRGENRTIDGVSTITGLNSYGNVPIVFSQEFGNMGSPLLTDDRGNEINMVAVLGQGQGTDRQVICRSNNDAIAESPWNIIESTKSATSQSTVSALNDVGDAFLEENQPQKKLDFNVLQLKSLYYGKDYTWGDRITAAFSGSNFNKLIIGSSITVSAGQIENININFGDV